MDESETTAAIQRYLNELAGVQGDTPVDPIVSARLARSAHRLHLLCASLLYRSYPRLTRPPYNLQAEEVLSAVVERLLKALREARPQTVRQFFAMTNQHMRWEMNDLARRLDDLAPMVDVDARSVPSMQSSGSELNPNGAESWTRSKTFPKMNEKSSALYAFRE